MRTTTLKMVQTPKPSTQVAARQTPKLAHLATPVSDSFQRSPQVQFAGDASSLANQGKAVALTHMLEVIGNTRLPKLDDQPASYLTETATRDKNRAPAIVTHTLPVTLPDGRKGTLGYKILSTYSLVNMGGATLGSFGYTERHWYAVPTEVFFETEKGKLSLRMPTCESSSSYSNGVLSDRDYNALFEDPSMARMLPVWNSKARLTPKYMDENPEINYISKTSESQSFTVSRGFDDLSQSLLEKVFDGLAQQLMHLDQALEPKRQALAAARAEVRNQQEAEKLAAQREKDQALHDTLSDAAKNGRLI